MSASRNSFKFTLKPSSLSQHTANFNKILEQVPAPKIDPLELVKPIEIKTDTKKQEQNNTQENKTEKENTQSDTAASAKEFIFGEKLTDRVINVVTETDNDSKPTAETDEAPNSQHSTKSDTEKPNELTKPIWSAENESDQIENNEANTILKLNCKLFVLETEKAKWSERGYGILKIIDSNDGSNCKIMMWTDKCFRLILNTKFFDKMQLDRANQKSIRFNAYDAGSIRIFLIKTGNANDCDELYSLLEKRFNDYLAHLESTKQAGSTDQNVNKPTKDVLFKCSCELIKNNDESFACEIDLYNQPSSSSIASADLSQRSSTNAHELMLDIVQNETTHLTTHLKFIKFINKTKPFEFEINESNNSQNKLKVKINDQESGNKFLSYYEKEPQLHMNPDESSNDESDFKSNSDDESESESPRKRDDLNQSKSEEEQTQNKKRKTTENSSSDELNKKAFKKSESNVSNLNETDLKRSVEEQNGDEQETAKKSKISEDSNDQQ